MALALSAPLHAQSFSDEHRVNDDTAGVRQGSPYIQVGRDGRVYVLWIDFRSGRGEIAMSTSDDRGATFSPSRILLPGRTALGGMQRGAQFVVDRSGGLHMVWQERNALGKVSAMYARSLDGGATFSTPIFTGADSGRYNQDFPSIAIDSSDNVSIAWVDDRDVELGASTYTQIYYTRSSDRGATFGTPVLASRMPGGVGGSCECCNTALATAGDGAVFIAFRGNIENRRDVHVARSRDGGASFEVFQAASQSWLIGACPMTGSSIAVDRNGTAHVVWRDSRQAASGREIVYYATLGLDDSACSADLAISDSPKRTNFPSIGVTTEGHLVAAWQDTRADANDIQVTSSRDGGNTFAPSRPITGASLLTRQELVVLAVGPDDTRYAVWQDVRRDEGDILIARDDSPAPTIAPPVVSVISPLEGAVVVSGPTLQWSGPAGFGEARQIRYEVRVQEERSDAVVYPSQTGRSLSLSLVPGRYRWWVRTSSHIGSTESGPFSFVLGGTSGIGCPGDPRDPRALPMDLW